jgi:hypothetical protein
MTSTSTARASPPWPPWSEGQGSEIWLAAFSKFFASGSSQVPYFTAWSVALSNAAT